MLDAQARKPSRDLITPSSSARPSTVIRIKVPLSTSPAESSDLSVPPSAAEISSQSKTVTPSRPQPAAGDGGHSQSKRSFDETDQSIIEGNLSQSPTKIARLDTTTPSDTIATTDETTNEHQDEDSVFTHYMLGLQERHDTIFKGYRDALSTVKDMEEEVIGIKKEMSTMTLQHVEAKDVLVKERDAAVLLARKKEAESKRLRKERDTDRGHLLQTQNKLKQALGRVGNVAAREKEWEKERKEEEGKMREMMVNVAAAETEKEAMRIEFEDLQAKLTVEERQRNLAVSNADASRRARNEAQDALAAIQKEHDIINTRLTDETASLEHASLELEIYAKEHEQLRQQLIDRQAISNELDTLKARYRQLHTEKTDLSNQLYDANERTSDLQSKADARQLIVEKELATAARQLDESTNEIAVVKERMAKSEKSEADARWALHLKDQELQKARDENSRLKDEKPRMDEGRGDGLVVDNLDGVIDMSMEDD